MNMYGKGWNMKFGERICKVIEFDRTDMKQKVLSNNIVEIIEKYLGFR